MSINSEGGCKMKNFSPNTIIEGCKEQKNQGYIVKEKIFIKRLSFCRFQWLPIEGIIFLQDRPPSFVLKSPFLVRDKNFL